MALAFALTVDGLSAAVLGIGAWALLDLRRSGELLPGYRQRAGPDALRALPWVLGLAGGVALALRRPWASGVVEAAGWAQVLLALVQFGRTAVTYRQLFRPLPEAQDDGGPGSDPLEPWFRPGPPLAGAAVGLALTAAVAAATVVAARSDAVAARVGAG